jgi:hypothetical protein
MKDKKKLVVVVVLAIAVLGIGAFQFVNMSGGQAPQAKAEEPKKETSTEVVQNEGEEPATVASLYSVGMSVRDPFQAGTLPTADGMAPTNPTTPNSAPTKPFRRPGKFHVPQVLTGQLPGPMSPNGPGMNVASGAPIRNPDEFSYSVSGIITGAKPAAVFVNDAGQQQLVTVGGSISGDSQLVGVEKGKVTIRHKGKTQTINVGGTPNVK